MIKRRLLMVPGRFHFTRWETEEYQKYFEEIVGVRPHQCGKSQRTDVVLAHGYPTMRKFADAQCHARFGWLCPGFGFQPWYISKTHLPSWLDPQEVLQRATDLCDKYDAVFTNEGPCWERLKDHPKVHLVPYTTADKVFKKTRKRTQFRRIIQVARNDPYKGRHISKAAMELMPYEWEVYPPDTLGRNRPTPRGYWISWNSLKDIYQEADGFLNPCMIGDSPHYQVDTKYSTAVREAGLSGCIIFWHDCMKLGNSFETVFEISLDPKEIAEKIQDVVNSIDLDKHSQLTAEEFYEKCNAANAVKAKVDIMKEFI